MSRACEHTLRAILLLAFLFVVASIGSCGSDDDDGASLSGVSGADAGASDICPEGFRLCGTECVDTESDSEHCGSCTRSCEGGMRCEDGSCVHMCDDALTYCSGSGCVNLDSSPEHCGSCGNTCLGDEVCSSGTCILDCGSYEYEGEEYAMLTCGSSCVNPMTDHEHCGTCGNACANGRTCLQGQCVLVCLMGYTVCADACVNIMTDPTNCGGCGEVCDQGLVCNRGTCSDFCDVGLTNCDGFCVDLNSDPDHCGSCLVACDPDHAVSTCESGACAIEECIQGWGDCNLDPSDGCETDVLADAQHCGTCGVACADGERCSNGTCEPVPCDNPDHTYCHPVGCVNLMTDDDHCGSCGVNCTDAANGIVSCENGACVIASCDQWFEDCNDDPNDGCEANLLLSDNCGSCGNACDASNGTPTCESVNGMFVCGIQTCESGFEDCNLDPSDGCEVNTNTDLENCGSCGNVCSFPYAISVCTDGTCEIDRCLLNNRDCNLDPSDGCEVNTNMDPLNCGSCGNVCGNVPNGTSACSSGRCVINHCVPGYRDCNGYYNDGCETDVTDDVYNCGACRNLCMDAWHGTGTCTNGTCGIACHDGYANCSGPYPGDCETHIDIDPNNCGSCGNVCPEPAQATRRCENGTCGIGSCLSGFEDCNGLPSDGCEVNVQNNSSNCGSCGNVCQPGTLCYNRRCEVIGYAFGACKTEGCTATFRSACGTNMTNFASSSSVHSSDISACLGIPPFTPGATLRVYFDYDASANTCGTEPRFYVSEGSVPYSQSFTFPDCQSSGSSWFDFTMYPAHTSFTLTLTSGDWCSSVRIVRIAEL